MSEKPTDHTQEKTMEPKTSSDCGLNGSKVEEYNSTAAETNDRKRKQPEKVDDEIGKNESEDAKDDEEEAVTMMDVLQEEKELEEDALAVLGASDDGQCTYIYKGYASRQALYACLTCCPNPFESSSKKKENENKQDFNDCGKFVGGICLACSYHCHENHNLVELYTKRGFRCDCGNKKFPENNPCQLVNDKNETNEENKYSQNFLGLYCTCHRPYPDPEDSTPDAMVQCILCEDWYHTRHLADTKIPDNEEYSEMICFQCCEKKSFLKNYYSFAVNKNNAKLDESTCEEGKVDVEKVENNPVTCLLPGLKQSLEKKDGKPLEEMEASTLFLTDGWRQHLCKCDNCSKMYETEEVAFLLNPEDTVHFYEAQSKKEGGSQYESGMEALSKMDRVKQVEAIHCYNSMKENLSQFLQKFAQNKKVVKKEDIEEFFAQQKNKKPRMDTVPDSCR